MKPDKPFLNLLQGKKEKRLPIWLMRQAGRYLPEYRTLRAEAGSFLALCQTPAYAVEVTLQPLLRFDLDAAILFADILLVPMAMGLSLDFREGEGPVLAVTKTEKELSVLRYDPVTVRSVFDTLALLREKLPPAVTLLGFAGGLWTVACYMMEGKGGNFSTALLRASETPAFVDSLIARLEDATFAYLSSQIEAGAEAVQLFESWAGLLDPEAFRRFVIAPTARLVGRLKARHPGTPVIGFPRGAAPASLEAYARETGVSLLGLGTEVPLAFARDRLQPLLPVQGNLDPEALVAGGDRMRREAETILTHLAAGPYAFNLGHGVLPATPPEHVSDLIALIRAREGGA